MSAPHVTAEDVGTYWTRDDGSVWRLTSYAAQPTVVWERMDGAPISLDPRRECRGGVVGSPITEGFVRLVREDAAQQDLERAEAALRTLYEVHYPNLDEHERNLARAALGEQPA